MIDLTSLTDEVITALGSASVGEIRRSVYDEQLRRGLVQAPVMDAATQTPAPPQDSASGVHPPDQQQAPPPA